MVACYYLTSDDVEISCRGKAACPINIFFHALSFLMCWKIYEIISAPNNMGH